MNPMPLLRQSGVENLNLSETSITDAGLLEIAGCKKLSELTIGRCPHLTESGLDQFLAANKNPGLAITGTSVERILDRNKNKGSSW